MTLKKLFFSRVIVLALSYVSTIFLVNISDLALYAEIVFYLNTINLMVLLIRGYSNDSILRLVASKNIKSISEIIQKGKIISLIICFIALGLYFLNFINYRILFIFLSLGLSLYGSIITSIASEVLRFKNKIFKAGLFSTNGTDIIALINTILIVNIFSNNFFIWFIIFNSIFIFAISISGKIIIKNNFNNNSLKLDNLIFNKSHILEFSYSASSSLQSWLIAFLASNFLTKEIGGQFLFLIKMSSILTLGLTVGNYIFNSDFAKLYIEKKFTLIRILYFKRRNFSLIWFVFSCFILGLIYYLYPKFIFHDNFNNLNYFFLLAILVANIFYISTGPCSSLLIMSGKIKSAFLSANLSLLPYLVTILIIIFKIIIREDILLITIAISYSLSVIINNLVSYTIVNRKILNPLISYKS